MPPRPPRAFHRKRVQNKRARDAHPHPPGRHGRRYRRHRIFFRYRRRFGNGNGRQRFRRFHTRNGASSVCRRHRDNRGAAYAKKSAYPLTDMRITRSALFGKLLRSHPLFTLPPQSGNKMALVYKDENNDEYDVGAEPCGGICKAYARIAP